MRVAQRAAASRRAQEVFGGCAIAAGHAPIGTQFA
jgi:hypothetical protein